MVRLKVLGSGREVGRTAILLESRSGEKLLLDYGVGFDENDRPVFPLHVAPKELKGIVLSHAHLDHCGAIPLLYTTYSLPLYTTSLTAELSNLLLNDMLKISGYYLPYEDVEIKKMMRNVQAIEYGETLELGSFRITFLNAGHIPGSVMTVVEVDDKRILYTGDFNTLSTELLRGADVYSVGKVDVVIMEATYALYNHPRREDVRRKFVRTVLEVLNEGGKVLIPAFSVGRAQEIMFVCAEEIPEYPIYVDGMARQAAEILAKYPRYLRDYRRYMDVLERVEQVNGWNMRKRILKKPCIIISPAGMLKGGAALFYLKKLYSDPRNAVIFVSYQSPTTPGFRILEEGTFELGAEKLKVEARVEWFDFSSHCGRKELLEFIKRFSNAKIILVHTEAESGMKLAEYLREKSLDVEVPEVGHEEDL